MRNTIDITQISLYRYKKNSPKDVCDIGDMKGQERICIRATLERCLGQCVRVCLANGNGLRSKARKGPGPGKRLGCAGKEQLHSARKVDRARLYKLVCQTLPSRFSSL